ncbi:unnamed protein product [Mesocestoides corti]|uniref:Dynein regulatory complex protein 1/2 N-terminal domain-containing protein n=1 Tax=Mesocestoides corti TaxID=53468 RepID=A0A0R3UL16_MESCO|nr:unnamed protein product [Mesocestoides corti]
MAKKKLKNMTEAEKAARLEQQRLAALAAAKKKEDLLHLKRCTLNMRGILIYQCLASRLKAIENKHALRMVLEKKVNILWAEFTTCKANYLKATEERRAFYEELKSRNEQAEKDIEYQMIHLNNVSSRIVTEKSRLAKVQEEYKEKNRLLCEERDRLRAHFLNLKRQINQLHDRQFVKLTNLANISSSVRKAVAEMVRQANIIIGLGEQCRCLETEEEKVLPFYTSCLTQEEEKELSEAYNNEEDLDIKALLKRYEPLEIFWRRFSKAQLDSLVLLRERKSLEKENCTLRSLISQYLENMSISDKVMSQPNSLLIINGVHNLTVDPALKDGKKRPVATIKLEGAHMYSDGVTSSVK